MELRELRYFLAICEEGSLTAAAARLHVAQQSLSPVVAKLETALGVALLDRGAFGARPTPAGELLRQRAAAVLRDVDEMVRAVREAGAPGGGEVRMRYGLDTEHIVEPLLARVRAHLADVTVVGWTGTDSDNLRALRAGETDLVLAWAVAGTGDELSTATLAEEECVAAVPDPHPFAALPAVPVDRLGGCAVVMFPRASAPAVWDHIAAGLTTDARRPPRITETAVNGQRAMIRHAVEAGALTPVSRSLAAGLGRPDVRFLPFAPPIGVPAHLVWRPGLPAAAARVVTLARDLHRGEARG